MNEQTEAVSNLPWIRTFFNNDDNEDRGFRYKLCGHHMVQLQIGSDGETRYESNENPNEFRTVLDVRFAKYRANYMYVNRILNLKTRCEVKSILHTWNNKTSIQYTAGKFVYPDCFDPISEGVCAHGIHFFRTVEGAYFYGGGTFPDQDDIVFSADGRVHSAKQQSSFHYYSGDKFWQEVGQYMFETHQIKDLAFS